MSNWLLTEAEHSAVLAAIDDHRQHLADNPGDAQLRRELAALDRATTKLTLARTEHRL